MVMIGHISASVPLTRAGADDKRPPLEARSRRAGDARFRLPRGWEILSSVEGQNVKNDKPYLHLQHTDDDQGVTQIVLLQTAGTRGQLPEIALGAMNAKSLRFEVEADDVTRTKARQGYPVAYVRSSTRSKELRKRVEGRAFAMKPGRMVEVAVYISTAEGVPQLDRERELKAFMRALRFDSAKDLVFDPLEPRNSSHRFDLVTFSSSMRNQINGFGGMDVHIDYDYLALCPNGRYTTKVPGDGRLDKIDWEALREAYPTRVGIYRVRRKRGSAEAELVLRTEDRYGFMKETEGRVIFEAASGRESQPGSEDLGETVKKVEIGRATQVLIRPLPPTRLRGRYTYLYGSSGSNGAGSNSFSGTKTIALTRGGKFESSSFFSASFDHDFGGSRSSGVTSSEAPPTNGRYHLEGFTLTLTFDDGNVVERFCHPVGKDDDAMLMIGESPYLFKGRR